MERFTRLTSVAAPLPQAEIDTDIIYPARFLLVTDREGLEQYGFRDWRFDAQGKEKPGFPLAQDRWRGAAILVVGANFGCGSSREHAPWALIAMGLRCVIAPSFGDIFYNNCFKNGLLPIVVGLENHRLLLEDAQAGAALTIDLVDQLVHRRNAEPIAFDIDPRRRDALINGWDEIDIIVARYADDIARFEAAQRCAQPWLWENETKEGEP